MQLIVFTFFYTINNTIKHYLKYFSLIKKSAQINPALISSQEKVYKLFRAVADRFLAHRVRVSGPHDAVPPLCQDVRRPYWASHLHFSVHHDN